MRKRLEIWGLISTGIAVLGVLLNNGKIVWCFPLWICSNTISMVLHVRTELYSLVLRDAIFIALAAAGWWMWTR